VAKRIATTSNDMIVLNMKNIEQVGELPSVKSIIIKNYTLAISNFKKNSQLFVTSLEFKNCRAVQNFFEVHFDFRCFPFLERFVFQNTEGDNHEGRSFRMQPPSLGLVSDKLASSSPNLKEFRFIYSLGSQTFPRYVQDPSSSPTLS
jgi:hypothetical protein